MAFTAHLRLSVGNVREAVNQAREMAMKLGGYVKRMDDNSATLAIPVGKADEALAALKKSGFFHILNGVTGEGDRSLTAYGERGLFWSAWCSSCYFFLADQYC